MRTRVLAAIGVLGGLCAWAGEALSQAIDPFYASSYTFTDLGSVAGLPPLYGGLTFKAGDPSKILIGGYANSAAGNLYEVSVTRGVGGHITGFGGAASAFGAVGTYNDGGVAYGPGGVLFTSRWPVNMLGQTKPGSVAEDKVIDLGALGVASSHSALNFVPAGFGGAGGMKLVSWSSGEWYHGVLTSDGSGTFNLGVTRIDLDPGTPGVIDNLPGGPEGFVYISTGNPLFTANSILLTEYSANAVASYEVDAGGNPILSTRRTFMDGLTGAEGAAIDPLTGDFLFSTFGGGDRIVVVQGFTVLPPPVPEPESYAMLLAGLGLLGFVARSRKQRETI